MLRACAVSVGTFCVTCATCTDIACAPLQWSLLQARVTTSAQFVSVSPDWDASRSLANLDDWSPRPILPSPCPGSNDSHRLCLEVCGALCWSQLLPTACAVWPLAPSLSSTLCSSGAGCLFWPLSGHTRDPLQTEATSPHCPSRVTGLSYCQRFKTRPKFSL